MQLPGLPMSEQLMQDAQGQMHGYLEQLALAKRTEEWGRSSRAPKRKNPAGASSQKFSQVLKQQSIQALVRSNMADKIEEKVAPTKTQLDVLLEQRAMLSTQYAECSLQLRELEGREKNLGASLRLLYDQIKLAQESGKSSPQTPQPTPA
jgi:hypothetical protein